mmetsp:Transcript_3518/g.8466  ORF Transcript_3518/g.8466 Transcript_3518/m.8466 type:complete len:1087 (+) Transcript_3518:95-3355(+)
MALPPETKRWLNDRLHSLLGLSESHLVDYFAAAARAAASPQALSRQLASEGIAADQASQFATELYARVPRVGNDRISAQRAREREAVLTRQRNERYRLVSMHADDDSETTTTTSSPSRAAPSSSTTSTSASSSSSRRSKRSKTEAGANWEESESERLTRELALAKREARLRGEADPSSTASAEENGSAHTTEQAEESVEDVEARYRREAKELAEFEARLLERDQSKMRKVGVASSSARAAAEAKRRRELAEEERAKLVPHLRKISRRRYLTETREPQMIRALEEELRDEEELFGDRVTAAELAERERRRKQLELAKQRRAVVDKVVSGYQIPDGQFTEDGKLDLDKRRQALEARYQPEEHQQSEQAQWEQHQLGMATMRFGARDAAQHLPAEQAAAQNYDLVFEDQIEFIESELMAGKNQPSAAEREAAAQAAGRLADGREDIAATRRSLPIYPFRQQLLDAVRDHQVLIIVGETGSGKTTQIPQYLYESGWCKRGRLACTQPRRVAAMSVAKRVADEMGVRLGAEVGYKIRFEDCTSEKTRLEYMTDGMLLRYFLSEPDLKSFQVLIIDEAHERTLHTDILFGLVKDIARFRPDLKLLISSATMDAERFSAYFDDAPIFNIPGRRYPVEILYTKAPEADYLDACIVTVLQIHITQPLGDVLVFLTGQEEVDTAAEILQQRSAALGSKIRELRICRIYSTLPTDLQAEIFEPTPPGARKVVLATNIAETSLTIDNIVYVIDPGFSKQKSYDPRSGMESLLVTPVSRASAQQRAGRAGRVAPGKAFRLYTAWSFQNEMEENTIPEIQRTNLGNVVLLLKSLGINDLVHFDFMDPPPVETLIRALEQLYALGALNDRGELTKTGRRMAEFPLEPQISKMIIASEQYGCTEEILSVAGMLSVGGSIFYRPKEKAVHADNARKSFHKPFGDHLTLLNVYNQWRDTNFSIQWCYESFIQHRSMQRARDVREQLEDMLERVEILSSSSSEPEPILKAIAAGFFSHAAKLQNSGTYRTVKQGQTVAIHPSSSLYQELPRFVIYHELVYTSKEFMRQVVEIKPEWLIEVAPHYYKRKMVQRNVKRKGEFVVEIE